MEPKEEPTIMWDEGPAVLVYIISPWATAVPALLFVPGGIPQATKWKWFGIVELQSAQRVLTVLPFLRIQHGVTRRICIGTVAAVVWIPIVFLLTRYAAGPVLTTWEFIFWGPACIAVLVLPLLTMPLGLLGYALPCNYERAVVCVNKWIPCCLPATSGEVVVAVAAGSRRHLHACP